LKAYCDSDVVFVSSKWDDSSVQDLAGNLTRFEYDGNRRLVKRIRPVTRTGERNKSVLAEQVTRFFYNEADQLVREETDLLALTNGTNKGKLATELTYNLIDRVSRKVIKEEFMGDVTIKDDSNFTYSRQLDVTRLASANNQTVNLSFDYENTPPFSITNYSVLQLIPIIHLG
jgi:YD repeat-containing protein